MRRPRRSPRPIPTPRPGQPEPDKTLAVEITGPDIVFIEQLFRHVQARRRRARFDMQFDNYNDPRREELIKNLYMRAGAASALPGAPKSVPLTEWEITVVGKMRDDLDYANSYLYCGHDDPMMARADAFMARLHILTGRARALRYLDGVAVFRTRPGLPACAHDPAGATP